MHLFVCGLAHQTDPRLLDEQSSLEWNGLNWSFSLPVGEKAEFQLWWWNEHFLAPWLRLHIPVVPSEKSAAVTLPYGELRIHYYVQRKYDTARESVIVVGRILAMELSFLFGPEAFWNAFAVMERHQLTARIRVGRPTQPPLAQPYLVRAQTIQTSEFARRRTYKWLPRALEDIKEGSISPRDAQEWEGHAREAKELRRISGRNVLTHVTPRALPSLSPEEMDNDAWSNTRRVLPITLRARDGGIKVLVFNVGASTEGDVPYAESCYLRWESFAGGKEGVVQTDLTPHLKLTIHFERCAKEAKEEEFIQITQLVLDVRDYSQMLRHMGRCQGAKTI